jgi:hypothetical protein
MVICDFRLWRQKTRLKHRLRGELHRHSFAGPQFIFCTDRQVLMHGLLLLGQMHMWSKISRRTLWDKNFRFVEDIYFEDMQLVPRLALRAQSFVYVPQVWVAYRQRTDSILANMNLRKVCDLSAALLATRDQPDADALLGARPTAFAFSHLAARNFIGAMRFIWGFRHELDANDRTKYAQQILQNWRKSTVLNERDLLRQYLKRGELLRGMRFVHWLRRTVRVTEYKV